jgi:cytoskeletal protein RodZ
VTWENAVEAEEAPLVIYAAVVIGFALLALFAATQMRASGTSEFEELPVSAPEEEEEKDYEKSSIYDLSTSDSDDTEEGASEE